MLWFGATKALSNTELVVHYYKNQYTKVKKKSYIININKKGNILKTVLWTPVKKEKEG